MIYNKIGQSYHRYRQADDRLTQALSHHLNLESSGIIADIGAGTGNYSRALADQCLIVKAIEPSVVMQAQAPDHPRVEWFQGQSEQLPLANDSVDGMVVGLALHHFETPISALQEMGRVCAQGPIVILTFDPRQIESPWFADYFPHLWNAVFDVFPPLAEVAGWVQAQTSRGITIHPFPLPFDLQDHFMAAGWQRPELYLDSEIRAGMSGFALADQTQVEKGLQKLHEDLRNGQWDNQNGGLRDLDYLDMGYRFIVARS